MWNRVINREVGAGIALLLGGCNFIYAEPEAQIIVKAGQVVHEVSPHLTGACLEDVNHEVYGGIYSQMIFGESFQEPTNPLDTNAANHGVSGMWNAFGSATGQCAVESENPFVGKQCQRVTFIGGAGEFGIANEGLNRCGMYFAGGQPYEGCLWVRAAEPTTIYVALESRDGSDTNIETFAEQSLSVTSNDWQRLDFQLTPSKTSSQGRFSIKLKQPGSIVLGYAFLQPGPWGRYRGLPVRRDVVEGLLNQGVTVLRYGGSMVNAAGYRWKNMVGPRDQRPPYAGTWYPYSSDGWGIIDFFNLCEATGITPIPDLNVNESPQDISDFVDYVNGPTNTPWGARRAADGHPLPYHLKYMELGNEERVDDSYFQKFKPLAEAIWARDSNLVITVGDFAYRQTITDANNVKGADSGITNLNGQRAILELARQYNREVWFDVHVWTEGPMPSSYLPGMFSFDKALGRLVPRTRYNVVVYELNANNHSQRRALANALAINAAERDGRLPVMTSANCLQPDGQNDNGWNQGLLFLTPAQVWLQPPGYVTQMKSACYLPLSVQCDASSPGNILDVSATRSRDGHTLVLQVVNPGSTPISTALKLDGFTLTNRVIMVQELAGPLDAVNTSANPENIAVTEREWWPDYDQGAATFSFAPYSFTVLKFGGEAVPVTMGAMQHP